MLIPNVHKSVIVTIVINPTETRFYILTLKGKNSTTPRHSEQEIDRGLRQHLAVSALDVLNHQLSLSEQYSPSADEVIQK